MMTPVEKRAERRSRNQNMVDMNLVSLIDVFTILIFFLLSNSGGVETLPSPRAVKLPESLTEVQPRDTVVVAVSPTEVIVDGRKIVDVATIVASQDDVIEPLKAELDLQAGRQMIKKENEQKGKRITIMGDREIPYRVLRKVMVSAARAGFSDVSFAVRQKPSDL